MPIEPSLEIDRASWDRLARASVRVPLQQSVPYGQAMAALGRRVHRFFVGADYILQAVERPLAAGISLVLASRGPLALDLAALLQADRMTRMLRERAGRCLLLWSPTRCIPDLGRPVVTGYATAWVDLRPDQTKLRAALDSKWRNQLARAEHQGLLVRLVHEGPPVRWLSQRHEEHRRMVGYRALPVSFLEGMAAATPACSDRLVLLAERDGLPVAGIWLQIHHGSATYLIGYADASGRKSDAMRLLLWRGMLELRERGVRWLDLGGVATDRAPGLSRFKFGMGGAVTVEAGTYFRALLR